MDDIPSSDKYLNIELIDWRAGTAHWELVDFDGNVRRVYTEGKDHPPVPDYEQWKAWKRTYRR